MFGSAYLNKLKDKYNYDNKTINALAKIIPCFIEYYGDEYEDIILTAIHDCEIIPCSSYETISKIASKKKMTKNIGESLLENLEIKRGESAYLSNIKVSYNEENNTFNIDKITRTIATSHTYNYDSPKGLEVLTYALCKLVKSYKDEYVIDENKLIKRNGISSEVRQIVKDNDEIYLDLISEEFKGLEEGLTIYDTEQIVSLVLADNYKCYDYDSVYVVAQILKEKFNLYEISDYEIDADIDSFKKLCDDKVEILSKKCNECLILEHEMFISMFRDEKDRLAKRINKELTSDIYSVLIDVYKKRQSQTVKS